MIADEDLHRNAVDNLDRAYALLFGRVTHELLEAGWRWLRGDVEKAVEQLKSEPGKGLLVGSVTLPQALAELGLIDEYELVVHPRLVEHGPTLFAGLSRRVDLKLVSRLEFRSGAWRCGMRRDVRRPI
jgi:riboflavin biosynthesis pyrimidine reductase